MLKTVWIVSAKYCMKIQCWIWSYWKIQFCHYGSCLNRLCSLLCFSVRSGHRSVHSTCAVASPPHQPRIGSLLQSCLTTSLESVHTASAVGSRQRQSCRATKPTLLCPKLVQRAAERHLSKALSKSWESINGLFFNMW